MATLTKRMRAGSLMFEIQFYASGVRKTIPLGKKYTERTADEMREVVEILIHCQTNGIEFPGPKTAHWIEHASPEIQKKLSKAGLVKLPERRKAGELWATFLASKTDIKESTFDTYRRAEKCFFMFFDPEEELPDLTTPRMEQWKDFLRTQAPRDRSKKLGLKESTTAGMITKTKAVFNWAVRVGWIEKSPLDGIGRGSFVNLETEQFVTMDEYFRLLEVCPCQDWRCILALVRVGGLRAPSEVLRLRWSDVNWDRRRFYVTSSKTERYRGKAGRLVPLWDPLREELERLFFNLAGTPAPVEYVINRYRRPSQNLGTQFARIVKMAGVGEIQRPFDNMRASRSNEVYASDGAICEAAWIGHSMKTAKDHYLRVREEDFERTLGIVHPETAGKTGRKSGFPAVGKILPAKIPAVQPCTALHGIEGDEMESNG